LIRKSKAATAVVGVLCSSLLLVAPAVSQAAGIKLQNVAYDIASKELVVKAKLDGFEGPTAVSVIDGENNLLASGSATKQVSFRIPYDSIFDVPCDITLFAGDEYSISEVKNCAGPGQTYEIVLSGIVTDEPIPNATVSVTLDGVTYTTTADEFGNYELPILSANLNQLVRIDAEGTSGSGEPIEFTSLTGTFSRVLDGESSGNVTNVTTASYVLTVEANGGTEPTTEEELATAETAVDATELFELAALIKLIVDSPPGSGGYTVPEGQSLLEFISDPLAVEAYLEAVPQEDLAAALAEILNDSNLVAGFTAAEIPERYFAIPVAEPGYIARVGRGIEFDSSGNQGTILDLNGSGQPIAQRFNWSLNNGSLVIDPLAPLFELNFPSVDEAVEAGVLTPEQRNTLLQYNVFQIRENRNIKRYVYTRVTDGTLVDIARVRTTEDLFYPDVWYRVEGLGWFSLTPATTTRTDVERTDQSTLRSSLDIEPTPFSATCNGQSVCAEGVWGGLFHYTLSPGVSDGYVWPTTAYGDIMTFAAGGAANGTLGSASATWSIDAAGALVIQYADNWTQRMEILDELNGEYGIFSDYTNADGTERFATYTVYSRADTKPVLSETDVTNFTGEYYNGEVNTWIPGSFLDSGLRIPDRRFGWQFFGDGSGRRLIGGDYGCGPGVQYDPMTWQVVNNAVEISYFSRVRTWYPAATGTIDGDKVIYVLEIDRFNNGDLLFPARLNIEREIPVQDDYCAVVDNT